MLSIYTNIYIVHFFHLACIWICQLWGWYFFQEILFMYFLLLFQLLYCLYYLLLNHLLHTFLVFLKFMFYISTFQILMHKNHLGILLKWRFWFNRSGWNLWLSISNETDVNPAAERTTFWIEKLCISWNDISYFSLFFFPFWKVVINSTFKIKLNIYFCLPLFNP